MQILLLKTHKTIILYVILYGCETWSLILREEHNPKISEKRVLRRILEPKRDEVIGGWRKLHNEELHNLCSSPNIIRMIKPCSTHKEKRNDIGSWRESQEKETTRKT
jgi:hypothetical protein